MWRSVKPARSRAEFSTASAPPRGTPGATTRRFLGRRTLALNARRTSARGNNLGYYRSLNDIVTRSPRSTARWRSRHQFDLRALEPPFSLLAKGTTRRALRTTNCRCFPQTAAPARFPPFRCGATSRRPPVRGRAFLDVRAGPATPFMFARFVAAVVAARRRRQHICASPRGWRSCSSRPRGAGDCRGRA